MKAIREIPLQSIALGFYDGPHATPPETTEGRIFLRLDNITPEGRLNLTDLRFIAEADFPRWIRRVKPQPGDVVFSYEATLHRYVVIPDGFDGCLGRRLALIRPNRTMIEPQFLHYYFLSPNWRRVTNGALINGATVDRFSLTLIRTLPIRLPDLQSQRRMIHILAAYDDLIENNRRRMALLEEAARLLYREWFVHLRFPGHERARITNNVPYGWAKAKLGEVMTLKRGYDLPELQRVPGEVPIVSSSGITGFHNEKKADAPGVVTGRYGTLGEVYLINRGFWPLNTALYVSDFKGNSAYFVYHFLKHSLQSIQSEKAAVPGLNRNVVHDLDILWPSKFLRDQFVDFAQQTQRQIAILTAINDKLRAARDLLLPRLMSGEVAV